MPTTLTKKGISVTFAETLSYTTLHDGNFLVHVGTGSVTMTSYSPAATGSGAGPNAGTLRNGASINLPGQNEIQPLVPGDPFDGRTNYGTAHSVVLPQTCVAGDSVVVAKSAPEGVGVGRTRSSYWSVNGDSYVDEMLSIVFVSYAAQSEPLLRPLGLGAGPCQVIRASYILRESQMDLANKLPSVIDLSTLGVSAPAWSTLEALVSDFCGAVRGGWPVRFVVPQYQHPGYGTIAQGLFSTCYVMLCSTESVATKTALARSLVQWGLDMAGAYLDGRLTEPNGGNIQGCRGLIVFAGHMLGIPAMKFPDLVFGEDRFADTRRIVPFDPLFVGATGSIDAASPAQWWWGSPEWLYRWDFVPGGAGSGWGDFQRYAPANWTGPESIHSTQRFGMQYISQVAGCHIGQVLAFQLMGLRSSMGEPYMTFHEDWMENPPPSSALAELAAVSTAMGSITWGDDYVEGLPAGFNKAAWQAYWPL